jgi:hypothetical protein
MKMKMQLQTMSLMMMLVGSATAQVVIDYSSGFTGATGLTYNGTASLAGSVVNTASGAGFATGTFYSNTQVNLTSSFTVDFTFDAGPASNGPGFAFAITGSNTAIGNVQGVYDWSSFAFNGALLNTVAVGYNVPIGNNLSITANVSNAGLKATAPSGPFNSATGVHTGQITFDSTTNTLSAQMDGLTPVTQTVNIASIVGSLGYLGFGGGQEVGGSSPYTINTWKVTMTAVPEPSTVVSLGFGMLLLVGTMRFRRSLKA